MNWWLIGMNAQNRVSYRRANAYGSMFQVGLLLIGENLKQWIKYWNYLEGQTELPTIKQKKHFSVNSAWLSVHSGSRLVSRFSFAPVNQNYLFIISFGPTATNYFWLFLFVLTGNCQRSSKRKHFSVNAAWLSVHSGKMDPG